MASLRCHACGTAFEFSLTEGVGRRDECNKCRSDMRVCKNCRHYDVTARWECRESISEAVREKAKANFCDFFQPSEGLGLAGVQKSNSAEDLLKRAESLFKKS